MITVALTYRNRDLQIVENCLDSFQNQTNTKFIVVLVDYGSVETCKNKLSILVSKYSFVKLIQCKTQQQLWCKSRAINIVLKPCETVSFFVGDIDMIYHPNFIKTLFNLQSKKDFSYFQVGFLSEAESKTKQAFNNYKISFKSTEEATGMTLYNTNVLKSINGYDEFYHGWGTEDTDVHVRLKQAGFNMSFYTDKVLMLHQWHPKNYRKKNDITPFHTTLEQINHEYLKLKQQTKSIKENLNFSWGNYNDADYDDLNKIDFSFKLTNKESEIKAFINNVLLAKSNKIIQVNISEHEAYKSLKQAIKSLVGKKTIQFLEMQRINNMLLEAIISNLRDKPYNFQYHIKNQTISLTIKL
ncbi:glycosyltransferase family 2 protein [Jejuia spongiicola]|uniref:Galactosyltransferase-related protein n=1 Tax=Jejuia spongiicola TaxID=2942207 RepID=A0ABT0QCK0_9FLAO|nr:galactosyltransferase-related protein [Jejuia spongiicola]MCL6294666.1 galactosyltransferase-related protein [Jejuia spongiicola]